MAYLTISCNLWPGTVLGVFAKTAAKSCINAAHKLSAGSDSSKFPKFCKINKNKNH